MRLGAAAQALADFRDSQRMTSCVRSRLLLSIRRTYAGPGLTASCEHPEQLHRSLEIDLAALLESTTDEVSSRKELLLALNEINIEFSCMRITKRDLQCDFS